MVAQQIRPWDVHDERLLAALEQVDREPFVPAAYRNLAFSDVEIPLTATAKMLFPRIEARLLQSADLQPTDEVLIIGGGSGYLAAVAAQLVRKVTVVEIDPTLVALAQQNLAAAGLTSVTVVEGDGSQGHGPYSAFDAILVTGSLPELPPALPNGLRTGGRLLVVVGREPIMQMVRIERQSATTWQQQSLFETVLAPLYSLPSPLPFTL